jgi:phosphatidylethanolamine/phosphatidyl-N-methylethanolamine N-methyltransferase
MSRVNIEPLAGRKNKMGDESVNSRRNGFRWDDGIAFFLGFMRHPRLVASIVPSSRFLTRRLAGFVTSSKARVVVELGPGIGGTTRAILDALPEQSRLLAIEINPDFIPRLRSESDPRLIVHSGCAERIREALDQYGLGQPDVVISGIPFSTMPTALGRRILNAVWSCLRPGGRFVAYQVSGRVAHLGRDLLGTPETDVALLNVPPMRLFHWRKPAQGEPVRRSAA